MFKFLKRFFEPALRNKGKSFKLIFDTFISYLWYDLIPIVSIPILIGYINGYDLVNIERYSIIILAVTVFLLLVQFITTRWGAQARAAYEMYLTQKYFKRSILKDPVYMDKVGSGKLQSIIKVGIQGWGHSNYGIVYGLTRSVTGILTGVYILLNFDIKYVPYFILIIIVSCVGYYAAGRMKLKHDDKVVELENDIDKDYVRVMMSRQEVILAANENKENDTIVSMMRKQLKENNVSATYDHAGELFSSGVLVLLPIVGVLFLVQDIDLNPINAAFLISFIYFSTRFSSTIYNMLWVVSQIFDFYPKIKKLWNFIDEAPDFENYNKGKKFVHGKGDIELINVCFSYGDKKVFDMFDLKITGGQKIAFVGKSGSGKTTIAKMITGFIAPQEGQVLVDGQDLSRTALKTYYRSIGYLTQEPMVFDGSVRDNLLYSLPEQIAQITTDIQLFEALKNAECDFVTNLDTQIGEKGIRLSGGERQRLAIAKLMLKNPEIIILDEPTSALDSFSEEAITRALDRLFKNKTVIIIAHRLQTVKKADTIIVMENGKIIEQGTHQELIEKDGNYKKMVDLQSGF